MLRVVWVTGFSNSDIRNRLTICIPYYERVLRRLLNKPSIAIDADTCIWNTNAIREFEKFDDVELHIIAPYFYLKDDAATFSQRGITYHFFKDECDSLFRRLQRRFCIGNDYSYEINSKTISNLINDIDPDVIHYMGAENPNYSASVFALSNKKPIIVQLQTLMNEPGFSQNYPLLNREYEYRSKIEKRVIQRADYIGKSSPTFEGLVKSLIKPDAKFVNTSLALTEEINQEDVKKSYDLVYFAADISKAADLAIEAFAKAQYYYPNLTLNIIGHYTPEYKSFLKDKEQELGIKVGSIHYEGKLPTHDDVLRCIRQSKFALLPLKVDLVSGTIRESMANGLPVITTITQGTPSLNEERESVLLSEIGDSEGMAANIGKLIDSPEYAEMIKKNAFLTANSRPSNFILMRQWIAAYHAVIKNFHYNIPIPDNLL